MVLAADIIGLHGAVTPDIYGSSSSKAWGGQTPRKANLNVPAAERTRHINPGLAELFVFIFE